MSVPRVIAYGGGVQSSALCVLAIEGRLDGIMGGPVDAALFSNVGDDSEHPDTLRYVAEVMTPWAGARGLPIHTLQRVRRDGTTETLWGRLTKPGSRSIGIPIRMPDTGAPGRRRCTADFKINVLMGLAPKLPQLSLSGSAPTSGTESTTGGWATSSEWSIR